MLYFIANIFGSGRLSLIYWFTRCAELLFQILVNPEISYPACF
jgi:hypothetical protein